MCHALIEDVRFFKLLRQIDDELAQQARASGCSCGGVLHQANYPRKPRGCPSQMRAEYESRLSFCCATCRKRCTSMSVRFLGRRVYLGLVVVLASVRRDGQTPVTARLSQMLEVPLRTLQRWRQWWCELFPLTTLWQAMCARFMPAVVIALLPASLLERFGNSSGQALTRLLVFLSPLTVSAAVGLSITLRAGS